MKKIELIKGVHSSVLGFGCASVLGAKDAKTSRMAIELAIEKGINHFDLAKSYGYGDAEAFVGRIIKNKKENIVIASKFGIEANWKARLLKPVKPFLRTIRSLRNEDTKLKGSKENVPAKNNVAELLLSPQIITAKELQKSLHESLKKLNRERIEYFFIHEPRASIQNWEQLFEEVDRLKQSGKIGGFGLASDNTLMPLHQEYIMYFDLLQFNSPLGFSNYDLLKQDRSSESNILFAPFSNGGSNYSPEQKLHRLFEDFPKSVILCSMFNARHLKSNIEITEKLFV